MKKYNYDYIKLPSKKDNISYGDLSVNDLDEKSKNLIKEVYKEDFKLLQKL